MAGKRSLRTATALLCLLAGGFSGCSMCQDCYDDAPPVVGSNAEIGPGSTARAGSAVSGVSGPTIVSDARSAEAEGSGSR